MTSVRNLLLLALAAAALSTAGAARAIIGGQPDGERHPSVGLVAGYDAEGRFLLLCSGTLVAPTVVVTAAHCVGGDPELQPATLRVSFASAHATDADGLPVLAAASAGTPHVHPEFDGTRPFDPDYVSRDLGVIVLDAPVAGVVPAALPALDELAAVKGKQKKGFEVVGYGIQNAGKPRRPDYFIDFSRRYAEVKLGDFYPPSAVVLQGAPGSAGGKGTGCEGDSGGGLFLGSVVEAVLSGGDCLRANAGARLDTPLARDFLDDFVPVP
jgi:hypothetical protein